MSHVMIKPAYAIYDQQRRRSACASEFFTVIQTGFESCVMHSNISYLLNLQLF